MEGSQSPEEMLAMLAMIGKRRDPDTMGYLHSAFDRAPEFDPSTGEYAILLDCCTLTFQPLPNDGWLAEIRFDGAYDLREHEDLKRAVKWAKVRAREIIGRDLVVL